MFYSETLLSKTGPLARVWLSANLERKLSKSHILQSNIESSVGAIVGQDQAPMALRLSGQLLLGVVRIYSRKARYLLEDCNEALMKIKMAFRPGNVDLPAGATAHTTAQLTLPDVITELDLLLPDPTLDLGDLGDLPFDSDAHVSRKQDITLDSSQFIQDSMEVARGTAQDEGDILDMEEELDLDIGEDTGAATPRPGRASTVARALSDDLFSEPPSLEMGMDAPPERGIDEDIFDTHMDIDIEPEAPKEPEGALGFEDEEIDLGLDTGLDFGGDLGFDPDTTIQPMADTARKTPVPEVVAEEPVIEGLEGVEAALEEPRRSESPLSSIGSSVEPEAPTHGALLDTSYVDDPTRLPSEDIEAAHARQPIGARKRKLMIDPVIEIKGKVIKAQQEDHSRILIEPSFLPRDPGLLALMSLTKSGGLAHVVFHPKNIAPELANLLSPDFVKRMADLKRKREQDDQEEEKEEEEARSPTKHPRLELGDDSLMEPPMDETTIQEQEEVPQDEIIELPGLDEVEAMPLGDETEEFAAPLHFEGSTSPQPEIIAQGSRSPTVERSVAPDAPQPVSRETRHAVHVLREQFSEPNPKKSVNFQDLLPPQTTTRGDATKMFFEVLVLATKDAVKVKQDKGFGKIDVSAKKALWGAWAEERDEQQLAEEKEIEAAAEGRPATTQVVVGRERVEEGTAAA